MSHQLKANPLKPILLHPDRRERVVAHADKGISFGVWDFASNEDTRMIQLTLNVIAPGDVCVERGRRLLVPYVTKSGEGFLADALLQPRACGCRVTGNGSIPLPLTVIPCPQHRK